MTDARRCSALSLAACLQFSGGEEEKIKQAAGTFCSNQPFALEIIKTKQKKDSRFASFIQVPGVCYLELEGKIRLTDELNVPHGVIQ